MTTGAAPRSQTRARVETPLTAFAHCLLPNPTTSPPGLTALSTIQDKKKFSRRPTRVGTASSFLQPLNTKMENTRVFVSGLPPSCSNDQLRSHFAGRFQVTDAHVLPKRRMGFVGFKSNDAATQAVKYFNRTYMKMSKISVDLARPVCWSYRSLHCLFSFLFFDF